MIVASATAPAALSMPAAGLAAESGAPILLVDSAGVPRATAAELARLGHPCDLCDRPGKARSAKRTISVTCSAPAKRPGSARLSAVENAIKVARFTDGHFGWGVDEPGHGLVFANAGTTARRPGGRPALATGDYGAAAAAREPEGIPRALARYLADIQPGYGHTPVSSRSAVSTIAAG